MPAMISAPLPPAAGGDDDRRWARAGLAALSGPADGPPQLPPRSLVPSADALGSALRRASAVVGATVAVDPLELLAERAAMFGHVRAGRTSCGGTTDLLRAGNGWLAISLARPDDVDLLPAWMGVGGRADLGNAVRDRDVGELVAAGVELGLPVARLGEVAVDDDPVRVRRLADGHGRDDVRGALVVDLSSLWAGPLCASLLSAAGARVVKVESLRRPDGARRGPAPFFDLLHGGQESVALDFAEPADRELLAALLARADIVVESSRPRALAQLGLHAEELARGVWISITGHGRDARGGLRVAFGDDAAVAGGLAVGGPDDPWFCADAIADPLTGLTAAVAGLEQWRTGATSIVDVAMARVAAWCARGGAEPRSWDADAPSPRARRQPIARARPLGADTAAIRREVLG